MVELQHRWWRNYDTLSRVTRLRQFAVYESTVDYEIRLTLLQTIVFHDTLSYNIPQACVLQDLTKQKINKDIGGLITDFLNQRPLIPPLWQQGKKKVRYVNP
jgi:hypothetical protein